MSSSTEVRRLGTNSRRGLLTRTSYLPLIQARKADPLFYFFLHPLTCSLKPAWYSANGFVTGSCGYEGIEYCRKQYIIVVAGFCIFSAMIAVMDIETPKRKHFDVNISISHQWALKHLMYINC